MQLEETVKKKKIRHVTLSLISLSEMEFKIFQGFKNSEEKSVRSRHLCNARLSELFFKNNCPKNFFHENNNWNISDKNEYTKASIFTLKINSSNLHIIMLRFNYDFVSSRIFDIKFQIGRNHHRSKINFELSAEEFVTKRCERNPLKITPWWCDRRKTGTLPTYLQIRSLFHNRGIDENY